MSSGGIRLAKWIVGLVVLLLIAKAFQHYVGEVARHVTSVDGPLLAGGLALCILYRILNSSGWVLVLRAMHQPMPLRRGMRLWLLAESLRWLPGSVWGFCSRVFQATKLGVPPVIASASLPLELVLTIFAWCLVAALGIIGSGSSVDWLGMINVRTLLIGGGALAAVGLAAVLLVGKFPESRMGAKLRKLRSELLGLRAMSFRRGTLAFVVVLYTALGCLHGFAFFVVLRSISSVPVDPVAVIGINACGWLIGFLAIGAPGGIGVREAGAAFLLSTMMPLPTAIAASVLWRIVMIVDEFVCLGACLVPNAIGNLSWKPRAALDPAT